RRHVGGRDSTIRRFHLPLGGRSPNGFCGDCEIALLQATLLASPTQVNFAGPTLDWITSSTSARRSAGFGMISARSRAPAFAPVCAWTFLSTRQTGLVK